ncbi:hypothetical protein [Mucilaginibacter sp.]
MEFFIVRPDYAQIAKYHQISISREDLVKLKTDKQKLQYLNKLTKEQSKHGIELMIEPYDKDGKVLFDDEHVKEVLVEFEVILERYNLVQHRENLLFMIVNLVQSLNSNFDYLQYESYEFQQRLKELAGFMYSLKNNPKDKKYTLTLKSKDRETSKAMDTFNITDQKLIEWMAKFVMDVIDGGEAPVYLFGIYENAVNRTKSSGPTILRELKDAASLTNKSTTQSRNKQTAGHFCLCLIPYLEGETSLKVAERWKTNDKQLRFLYEICMLFDLMDKQFDPDIKDVTPERHMRTLLNDTRNNL